MSIAESVAVFKDRALSVLSRPLGSLILLIVAAVGSFSFGYAAGAGTTEAFPEARKQTAGAARVILPPDTGEGTSVAGGGHVVGSKKGTTYHLPWCAGARSIKEENRIVFENSEAARAVGYRPAANCPGLE